MATYANETNRADPSRSRLIALVFCVLSVVALHLPDGAQQRVASFMRATFLRPFVMTQEGLVYLRVYATETEALRQQLDSLAPAVSDRTRLAEENERLRRLLNLSEGLSADYVAARVFRPEPRVPRACSSWTPEAGGACWRATR